MTTTGAHRLGRGEQRSLRSSRWLTAGLLAAPVAGVGLAQVWTPSDADTFSLCPFRRLTGGWCPGCGLTRGVVHLVRGDWDTAWAYHPLAVLAVVTLVVVWAVLVGRRLGRTVPWPGRGVVVGVAVAQVAVFLAVWGLRLADGAIPRPSLL